MLGKFIECLLPTSIYKYAKHIIWKAWEDNENNLVQSHMSILPFLSLPLQSLLQSLRNDANHRHNINFFLKNSFFRGFWLLYQTLHSLAFCTCVNTSCTTYNILRFRRASHSFLHVQQHRSDVVVSVRCCKSTSKTLSCDVANVNIFFLNTMIKPVTVR